jgi:dTDP-4-dehydrorhamnose reductase
MTEKPFVHKKAFSDVEMNFMFHETLAKNLLKLIDKKGIINVGGKKQSVLNFANKYNKNIDKISARKIYGLDFPLKQSMNINLYKKSIK